MGNDLKTCCISGGRKNNSNMEPEKNTGSGVNGRVEEFALEIIKS